MSGAAMILETVLFFFFVLAMLFVFAAFVGGIK